MYLLNRKCLSLNDIESITLNIFNCLPPLSYGKFLSDGGYTSKKLRRLIITRYYRNLRN